ncbi:MAG: Hpt domain-containing protein, partial [Alphaproteobacteria bacterium]|nr:Hpt domain-containing protein [Alphaproteobacteria bacterium]
MDDLISEFLTETAESLDVIDSELVRFENNPEDRAILDNIFRLLHTVKGTCGFLGLPRLEAVAHAGETLLGKFRDGELKVSPPMVTLVLQAIDQIKELLESLEATGQEPAGDDAALISRLEDAAMGKLEGAEQEAPAKPDNWDEDLGRELRPGEVSLADLEAAFQSADIDPGMEPAAAEAAPSEPVEHLGVGDFDPELGRELRPGEVSAAELEAAFQNTEAEAAVAPEQPVAVKSDFITEDMSQEEALQSAMAELKGGTEGNHGEGGPRVQQTVRVGVDVLEALMTTVSELVLTRN